LPSFGVILKIICLIHAFLGANVHNIAIGRCPGSDEWVSRGGVRGTVDDDERWYGCGKTLLVGLF
jgi:hypothetical protein